MNPKQSVNVSLASLNDQRVVGPRRKDILGPIYPLPLQHFLFLPFPIQPFLELRHELSYEHSRAVLHAVVIDRDGHGDHVFGDIFSIEVPPFFSSPLLCILILISSVCSAAIVILKPTLHISCPM